MTPGSTGWMQAAFKPSHKGRLRKAMGVPQGQKIQPDDAGYHGGGGWAISVRNTSQSQGAKHMNQVFSTIGSYGFAFLLGFALYGPITQSVGLLADFIARVRASLQTPAKPPVTPSTPASTTPDTTPKV